MEGTEQERFVTQPDLVNAARHEMIREGFEPDFSQAVVQEVAALGPAPTNGAGTRDLRHLLWSSVDNPESRDLDQVEYAEVLPDGRTRVMIGIADVDCLVKQGSATDLHAMQYQYDDEPSVPHPLALPQPFAFPKWQHVPQKYEHQHDRKPMIMFDLSPEDKAAGGHDRDR